VRVSRAVCTIPTHDLAGDSATLLSCLCGNVVVPWLQLDCSEESVANIFSQNLVRTLRERIHRW
jgi:hypothetical protein